MKKVTVQTKNMYGDLVIDLNNRFNRRKYVIKGISISSIIKHTITLLLLELARDNALMHLQSVTTQVGKWFYQVNEWQDESEDEKWFLSFKIAWLTVIALKKNQYITINGYGWDDRTYTIDYDKCGSILNIDEILIGYKEPQEFIAYSTKSGKTNTRTNKEVVKYLQNVAVTFDESYIKKAKRFKNKNHYLDYLLEHNGTYYNTIMNDQRGRYYYKSSVGNIHSPSHEKAFLRFAHSKLLDDRGNYWLKLAVANELSNSNDGKRIKDYPNDTKIKLSTALLKTGKEKLTPLGKMLNDVKPSSITNVMVGFDMVSSGPAIMGIITKCKTTSRNCGLTGERRSPAMELRTRMRVSNGNAKASIMTHTYGSQSVPKRIFSTKVHKFYDNVEDILPGANLYLNMMKELWKVNSHRDEISYTIADKDVQYYINKDMKRKVNTIFQEKKRTNFISTTHKWSVRGINKDSRAFGVNILHSIDPLLVEQVVLNMKKYGISDMLVNHDCYYVHPNDVDKLMQSYREAILWLYDQDILAQLEESFDCKLSYIGDLNRSHIDTTHSLV